MRVCACDHESEGKVVYIFVHMFYVQPAVLVDHWHIWQSNKLLAIYQNRFTKGKPMHMKNQDPSLGIKHEIWQQLVIP